MVNKDEKNIENIKAYLNETLDAKAMHNLEKQALDDPFFAEALDGLLQNPQASAEGLSSLQAQLKSRTEIKNNEKEHNFNWRPWLSIAAVLFIFIGVAIFFLNRNQPQKNITDEVVKNVKPESVLPKDSSTQIAIIQPQSKPGNKVQKDAIHSHNITEIIAGTNANNKNNIREVSKNIVAIQAMKSPPLKSAKRLLIDSNMVAKESVSNLLEGRVAGLAIENTNHNQLFFQKKKLSEEFSTVKIVDAKTGKPIVGAIAQYNGNFNPSVSDSLGQFVIPDSVRSIDINAVGYVALNTPVYKNEVITLSPSDRSLNDVVVVGYGVQKRKIDIKENDPPKPIVGWEKFSGYVLQSILANYAIGDSGVVKIGFNVNDDGTLSKFKILKGLNNERNKQAIEILKNGSLWIPINKNVPTYTSYEIVFP